MGDDQRSNHYNVVADNSNHCNNLKRKEGERDNVDLSLRHNLKRKDGERDNVDLSLRLNIATASPSPSHPFPYRVHHLESLVVNAATSRRPVTRSRRTNNNSNAAAARNENKEAAVETIVPLFPWSKDTPAGIHSLTHLIAAGHLSIEGEIVCRRCDHRCRIAYDLTSKFQEVSNFVVARVHDMHDRAPHEWLCPAYPDCNSCKQTNCMKPVLADCKEEINWLFLFLGQMLGICTLEQLKWFCKHTHMHRTGARDRVLYLSYVAIGKQLQPGGMFDALAAACDQEAPARRDV